MMEAQLLQQQHHGSSGQAQGEMGKHKVKWAAALEQLAKAGGFKPSYQTQLSVRLSTLLCF